MKRFICIGLTAVVLVASACSPSNPASSSVDLIVEEHRLVAAPSTEPLAFTPVDGSMIEIIPAEGERGGNTLKTPGLRHLALTVTDFDTVYAGLQAKGVHFVSEPLAAKGNKVVFFTDPEGNYLHLLERETPLP